jgi:hypothetical protein
MTERRPLPHPPRARVVVLASAALFAVLVTVLALRMWAGRDPALGAQARAADGTQPVLVRRIERRVVVTEVRHRAGAGAAAATPAASPPPAPAAAAPAPPPAPAPVVTRSS